LVTEQCPLLLLLIGDCVADTPRGALFLLLLCCRWGEGEWKGAYNDKDTERWVDHLVSLATQANSDAEVLSRTSSGTVSGSDDGSFWMEWEDVTKYLSLGACNPFVLEAPAAETAAGLCGEWAVQPGCALAKVLAYRGEWRAAEGTAGGCTAGLFQFNPRVRISSTSKDCTIYATLSLPDLRFLIPDEDAQPELHTRYGLRYPSVCVLRRDGTVGGSGGAICFGDLPTDETGAFYDPQGWCDERKVPLVLDGTSRQASARIPLEPIKPGSSITQQKKTKKQSNGGKRTSTSGGEQEGAEEGEAASYVELMIVNEMRGAEGEFYLTLHSSAGELSVETLLPTVRPTPQQAAAMARDLGRSSDDDDMKDSAGGAGGGGVFVEEEEVGAELIAVLGRQQRELRAGAPLVDPPTPIGPMAAGYEGGPEDDAIAMSFAPAPPWVSPGVSRALCYATGCVVVGALVASLPALAKRDPEAAAWAVETAAGAREQAIAAGRVAAAAAATAGATVAQCCSGVMEDLQGRLGAAVAGSKQEAPGGGGGGSSAAGGGGGATTSAGAAAPAAAGSTPADVPAAAAAAAAAAAPAAIQAAAKAKEVVAAAAPAAAAPAAAAVVASAGTSTAPAAAKAAAAAVPAVATREAAAVVAPAAAVATPTATPAAAVAAAPAVTKAAAVAATPAAAKAAAVAATPAATKVAAVAAAATTSTAAAAAAPAAAAAAAAAAAKAGAAASSSAPAASAVPVAAKAAATAAAAAAAKVDT
jgi:hypothetical protein